MSISCSATEADKQRQSHSHHLNFIHDYTIIMLLSVTYLVSVFW